MKSIQRNLINKNDILNAKEKMEIIRDIIVYINMLYTP